MITFFIIAIALVILGCILMDIKGIHPIVGIGVPTFFLLLWTFLVIVTIFSIQNHEVTTPSKYINQTYYIDNSNRIYIQNAGDLKSFDNDISYAVEYSNSVKTPSIQFKSIKISILDWDYWNPFKITTKSKIKTSISKVILPKDAFTQKLTKAEVSIN